MRDVDDAVGLRRRGLEPVEVSDIPASYLGAERRHRSRGRVRPGQANDLMSGRDELVDDIRTDMAGPASN